MVGASLNERLYKTFQCYQVISRSSLLLTPVVFARISGLLYAYSFWIGELTIKLPWVNNKDRKEIEHSDMYMQCFAGISLRSCYPTDVQVPTQCYLRIANDCRVQYKNWHVWIPSKHNCAEIHSWPIKTMIIATDVISLTNIIMHRKEFQSLFWYYSFLSSQWQLHKWPAEIG